MQKDLAEIRGSPNRAGCLRTALESASKTQVVPQILTGSCPRSGRGRAPNLKRRVSEVTGGACPRSRLVVPRIRALACSKGERGRAPDLQVVPRAGACSSTAGHASRRAGRVPQAVKAHASELEVVPLSADGCCCAACLPWRGRVPQILRVVLLAVDVLWWRAPEAQLRVLLNRRAACPTGCRPSAAVGACLPGRASSCERGTCLSWLLVILFKRHAGGGCCSTQKREERDVRHGEEEKRGKEREKREEVTWRAAGSGRRLWIWPAAGWMDPDLAWGGRREERERSGGAG